MDLTSLSISQLQDGYRSGSFTPLDYVEAVSTRIQAVETRVRGFLSFDIDALRESARNADISLPLGGIPVAIKDVINVKGDPCHCASRMLEGYVAPYDATVIRKLREAGAIPFGRTNMDEFAMGSSTENSAFHPTGNPWAIDRTPGGSSGGSAAVVAAREAVVSLGSDTGGSIRQPAALCGCVGLKPTYGRVSRFGLVAFASSLDQIGPFSRNVRDSALLLNVISGKDTRDSTSIDQPVPDFTHLLGRDLKGVRIGLPKEYFVEGTDPKVSEAVQKAVRQCESLGAEVIEISLPHTEYAVAVYYILATAEASANLARFDGVRYGHRAEGSSGLLDHYGKTRAEGFGPEVKRRIILGTYVLSSGYYDAYYLRAQKVRTLIRQDFEKAFEKVDVIVSPTSPEPAFKLGERSDDPLRMYLADIFTIAANLAGNPGISVPCGFAESDGVRLPVGLQFLGKPFGEDELLRVAHAYEQSAGWHNEAAPLG
jgi:aspartyl-tRNA(Asn)/glutamyl-tRNA(Gln) amidotransferase subunit A